MNQMKEAKVRRSAPCPPLERTAPQHERMHMNRAAQQSCPDFDPGPTGPVTYRKTPDEDDASTGSERRSRSRHGVGPPPSTRPADEASVDALEYRCRTADRGGSVVKDAAEIEGKPAD